MRSFFNVSVLFKGNVNKILMRLDVRSEPILKNPKKTCFQNGNTICEHNFHILFYRVIEKHQVFLIWTLKKKEQKRARSILADFLKNIFF